MLTSTFSAIATFIAFLASILFTPRAKRVEAAERRHAEELDRRRKAVELAIAAQTRAADEARWEKHQARIVEERDWSAEYVNGLPEGEDLDALPGSIRRDYWRSVRALDTSLRIRHLEKSLEKTYALGRAVPVRVDGRAGSVRVWDPEERYRRDDVVYHEPTEAAWKATLGGRGWEPGGPGWERVRDGRAAARFARNVSVEVSRERAVPWFRPDGDGDAYQAGDVVLFEGEAYRSNLSPNFWSPEEYPEAWTRLKSY